MFNSLSTTQFNVFISLLCGMLVYNVERSYFEMDLTVFRLLRWFKVPITGLLFWVNQNQSTARVNLLSLWYFSSELYNNLNDVVTILLKDLITHYLLAVVNLVPTSWKCMYFCYTKWFWKNLHIYIYFFFIEKYYLISLTYILFLISLTSLIN